MNIIDNEKIFAAINATHNYSKQQILTTLAKAKELKGLNNDEVLMLLNITDESLLHELFAAAKYAKDTIYGSRLVLFAPMYVSNLCHNECLYCAFRTQNKKLVRKALSYNEIKEDTEILINQGHKRILLVAGESYPAEGLNYIFNAIDEIYSIKTSKGSIRRINVNIAPLSIEDFKLLNAKKIGTYQLFQETYHEPTYKQMHVKGPKSNYNYRLSVMDRALQAGIHDVGIGVLFGLYDYKYEVLALLSHCNYLEKTYGVGPHTISVPRIEPALNSDVSYTPPNLVSDLEFKKIIAVLRLAVPYTGIILSTREKASLRKEALDLGVSQISAGSRTNPGGYKSEDVATENLPEGEQSQFSLGDTRSLHEIIEDVLSMGFIPSFCTGCYRNGRVGKDFMDLAKPGLIKANCFPNALFTFAEYLCDFATPALKAKGFAFINSQIENEIANVADKNSIYKNIALIENGERDIYI